MKQTERIVLICKGQCYSKWHVSFFSLLKAVLKVMLSKHVFIRGLVIKCKWHIVIYFLKCSWMLWTKHRKSVSKLNCLNCSEMFHYKKRELVYRRILSIFFSLLFKVFWRICIVCLINWHSIWVNQYVWFISIFSRLRKIGNKAKID